MFKIWKNKATKMLLVTTDALKDKQHGTWERFDEEEYSTMDSGLQVAMAYVNENRDWRFSGGESWQG